MPDRRQGDRRESGNLNKKITISLQTFIAIVSIVVVIIMSVIICKIVSNRAYNNGYNVGYEDGYDSGYDKCFLDIYNDQNSTIEGY